jgi:excisionase family DNA binding protein
MSSPLVSSSQRKKSRTYLPTAESRKELAELAHFFRESDEGKVVRALPSLRGPDGFERELPQELFDVLEQVATALANGEGVTVAPNGMRLTTQEAADFLGISRPTLVKLLDAGEIPHEMRGRHRRVMLKDLVEYQERFSVDRRTALRELTRESQESGMARAIPGDLVRSS